MSTPRTPRIPASWAAVAAAAALGLTVTACSGDDGEPPADGTSAPATAAPGGSDIGAATAGDPYTPGDGNGGYDVTHYGLTLRLNPGDSVRALDGTAELTATAKQPLARFNLDLAGLSVGGVKVDGAAARHQQRGSELIITPARPVAPGAQFKVTVAYSGTPKEINDPVLGRYGWIRTSDGVFIAGQPSGAHTWFPSNDHPSDKATFDFDITVPKGSTVVANGDQTSSTDGGAHTTWQVKEPMATYLATVDVGKFNVKKGTTPGGVPIHVAVDPSVETSTVEGVYANTAEITDAFDKTFGDYPFSSTGAIVDNADVGFALETQTRPVFGSFGADPTILAHELAHEWYGDSVSVTRWQDIWLNEGFATYAEWTWGERSGGPTVQQQYDLRYRQEGNKDLWDVPPGDPGRPQMFGRSVYDRGAMTLVALRQKIGTEKFDELLRTWARDHRGGNVTTGQFIALANQISGTNLDAFFRAWLYEKGRPSAG
ncbi:MAG TPA: M1 family metallopeptidase [Streptosporangiaceae bacterium]|nr:M1 family metallopeptidase [Streptosporangiaceae bacterium]